MVADDKAIYLFHDGKKRKVGEGVASPAGLARWATAARWSSATRATNTCTHTASGKNGDLDAKERYYPFWVRPKEPSGNAGLTLDAAGRAYATSREGVQVFDPTGRLSGILVVPERAALGGVAFGGADLDRLYVACGGKVYVRKLLAKGVAAKSGP